jgi:flagellar biosynthesis protein FlhF
MKLKRFFAPDMRHALRMVREEQGPDAVILSNQRVDGGIEIVAAVDYDPVLARQVLGAAHTEERVERTPPPARTRVERPAEPAPRARHDEDDDVSVTVTPAAAAAARAAYAAAPAPAPEPIPAAAAPVTIGELQREVTELRLLLERQLANAPWPEFGEREPCPSSVVRGLGRIGLDADLAMSLAMEVGPRADLRRDAREIGMRLDARLPVVSEEVIDEGGVVALVGPTGVGKTTTVAKLAARFALRHGKRRLALVSLDNFRIGAHEQLMTFGRILGVPVHFTGDADGLRRYVDQLADKALVLVDTAGVGQRDGRLEEQLAPLAAMGEDVRVLLTLAANTQRRALEEIVQRFERYRPSAIVLTKLDEAVTLGAALSVLLRGSVPLAYATDGQRVPEDIHFARSPRLALGARALAALRPDDARAPSTNEVTSCA